MLTKQEHLALRWMCRENRPMFLGILENGDAGKTLLSGLLSARLIKPLSGKGYVPTKEGRGFIRQDYSSLGLEPLSATDKGGE